MCGIAGFTGPMDEGAARALVRDMSDALAHRGPDGSGAWTTAIASGRSLALGHRRLAIIDLSEAAAQPFQRGGDGSAEDGDLLTIVFNGEIYNYLELRDELAAAGHVFRTTSDTEVLLAAYAAWGLECLARLRGMYAFAIWDGRREALFLARDPFGKKPLLYFLDGDDVVFASELAGLARHPAFRADIDPAALRQYLLYKYVPGDRTLLARTRELPPGHLAIWRRNGFEIRRHYSPPRWETDAARRTPWNAGAVAAFREALGEAVRIRMRADVPFGAFLSGGLDSSAIVALMAERSERPVRTFSVGFREEAFSELWAARLVAERFGADHHELELTTQDFLDNFETVTAHRGAPLSEMADVPVYLMSRLAAEHVKVVLSGEGSDELLAGYPKHWGDLAVARYQRLAPAEIDKPVLRAASSLLGYGGRRLQVMLRAAAERDFQDRQAAWFGLMNAAEVRRLCPGLPEADARFVWPEDPGGDAPALHRALLFDKTVWLPGTLLPRGDRLTMAASIEARMPFMDTELCDFVSRLPPQAFLSGRTGKQILRRAMEGTLPEKILKRPKSGFRVPVNEWLRGPMRPFLHDTLLAASARTATYCDPEALRRYVAEHESGERNREKELWSLLALEVFLRSLSSPCVRSGSAPTRQDGAFRERTTPASSSAVDE